jgi:hypothetical protein
MLRLELTGFPDNYFIRSARAGNKDVMRVREGLDLGENLADSIDVIVASRGATVEGVVQDERQAPVVGALVLLIPNADRRARKDLVKTVTSDQYGRFAEVQCLEITESLFGKTSSPTPTSILLLWNSTNPRVSRFTSMRMVT